MDKKSIPIRLLSRACRILGILIVVSAAGGCITRETNSNVELPAQNISEDNLTTSQNVSDINESISDKPNQIRLIIRPKELNRTGRLPITLKIINPRLNETVITVFKPQVGQQLEDVTNVTYIANNSWTRNFSIQRLENVSYVLMFVQISENNTVVKRASWNITFEAPVGRP